MRFREYRMDLMSEVAYWVGFSLIPGIGRVRFDRLLGHFGDLETAWRAEAPELEKAGIDPRTVSAICQRRPHIDPEKEMDRLESYGVRVLTLNHPRYPKGLKEIYDPPPVFYVCGALDEGEDLFLAVVGARRATNYGREVTERLVADLVRNNVVIVSGLARGIDTVAHRTALAAGGRTIAVLACGVDVIYPPENRDLAREIRENGALVSEYPLSVRPRAENFPRRNRIMSGLSGGTLVIEAAAKSGALITARMALEQDREVFAVPGSILSGSSRGSNELIREGAKAVLEVNDILEEFNPSLIPLQTELAEIMPENEMETALLRCLAEGPVHIDQLCRWTSQPVATVSSSLTMMELKGMVSQLGNMNYIAARGVKAG